MAELICCPCGGSNKKFADCCALYIEGGKVAPAEISQ